MMVPRLLLALLILPSLANADESQVVPLWAGKPPGPDGKASPAEKVAGKAHHRLVSSIHEPSLTVFLPPKEKATGAAVVICPGGGHRYLAIDHEGYDVARWLATQGIAGFVLKYRLANEEGSPYTVDVHALADARRAVRLVRGRGKEWQVDPARVGVMGFSAGGELAILAGTKFEAGKSDAADPIDRLDSRPDFLMLIYPGFRGNEFHVTRETPPTFLAVADDDKRCAAVCVGYYQELKKAGVAGELHIYGRGGHGFGMNDRPLPVTGWTARLKDWIADRGYLAAAPPRAAMVTRVAARPVPRNVSPPAARIKAPKGFQVDLIYSVPKETQGSWVNMTLDPKGRLLVSDQYGKLYRVALPGVTGAEIGVEAIDVPIGEAQGMLWAFDSLYLVVNRGRRYESGLYRVTDTNGDDKLDKVEQLRKLNGGGEHGPHAVVLAPDGKSLYIVAGNATALTKIDGSLVPRAWGEDNLLPRMVDGAGFMTDEKAPGGHICKVSPDGKHWELVAMGYRNPFDIAFNKAGELFTYDSDMEWDVNMPWYRPTRVLHVVSGGDYGYRNGSGKWPPYYIDSLPPVVNVGPGSPTGVTFGYGAKFPPKYQEALYLCDWSYGKLYALHLAPKGATYGGELEEFIAGTPLALTDVVVNPKDGAMYFAVGGRNTQSGLYRVTYTGTDAVAGPGDTASAEAARGLRHKLEAFHGHKDTGAVAAAWPYLGHPDRFVRWAARVAIEFQDPASWREMALAETSSPEASLNALLALTQVSAADPAHRAKETPTPDPALRESILTALDKIAWNKLDVSQQLDLIRVYEVVFNRFGRPEESTTRRLIARFDPHYPSPVRELNTELCNLLIYLEAPDAAAKTVALLEKAPTQEEQMHYAQALRTLGSGWTPDLRRVYFSWIANSGQYRGGNSLRGFMANIRRDATNHLSSAEKAELKPILDARPSAVAPAAALAARPVVKEWTVDELAPTLETGLKNRDFDRGRALFAAAKCFACHRCNDEGGGVGPDLTAVAGRFSNRDLLESIIVPSKTISDQYEAVTVATADGRVITGRIVNLNGDNLMINPDMLDPNNMVNVARSQIEEIKQSPISMMPAGLLNTLHQDEILDLTAYLLSRGDRKNPMFRQDGDHLRQ